MVLLIALLALQEPAPADSARAAVERTAGVAYAYRAAGRFERSGEWTPDGVLSARIREFQSARRDERIFVKGPEGLWRTPKEHLGETTENAPADIADVMRVLESARAPHAMAAALIATAVRVAPTAEAAVDGAPCRVYFLALPDKRIRDELEEQIAKETESGALGKPDETVWSSMRGGARLFVRAADGYLARVTEESSVKIVYRRENERPDEKSYKLQFTLSLSDFGKAKLELPPEAKQKLGVR
jgi:hypothetical protein